MNLEVLLAYHFLWSHRDIKRDLRNGYTFYYGFCILNEGVKSPSNRFEFKTKKVTKKKNHKKTRNTSPHNPHVFTINISPDTVHMWVHAHLCYPCANSSSVSLGSKYLPEEKNRRKYMHIQGWGESVC